MLEQNENLRLHAQARTCEAADDEPKMKHASTRDFELADFENRPGLTGVSEGINPN